jgi:periplasmic protein TonB
VNGGSTGTFLIKMSEVESWQKVPFLIWVLAAFGAGAIHAGCVALALQYMQPADEEALGAPAIEIGLELTTTQPEPTDLPPGPEVEASAASPAVVEQKAVIEPTDLPKAVPTETDDPERLVAPTDPQKPKDDELKTAIVQTAPSDPSVAAEATAAPSSETVPKSSRSVAPAQGTGDSAHRARVTWQKELVAHFDKHKRYPSDRSRQSAEVLVNFELDRTGHILSTSIVRGSGDPSFDEAALAMIRRSDPVPQPPPLVADEGLNFTLPVIFRVKGRN